jgi:glycosyltransferase involved in cell wall biosynthesis
MSPLVSIVLPTYNRPQLLRRALWCIKEQTFTDYEVIVVNDAGDFVSGFPEFQNATYIDHSENKGLSASRNTGIKAATGKYITYQDDDDIWFPEHLETLVEHLESLPQVHAAYTDCYRWYDEKYLFASSKKSGDIGKNGRTVVAIICLMHERKLLDDLGMFDEEMRCMEDWDFIIRMNRKHKILHIPQFTACYSKRMSVNQLSTDADKMRDAYNLIKERHGISPPKYKPIMM